MKKLKVGVLMGGPSAEREVSLVTGKAVFDNLDRKKYNPVLIEMSKDRFFWLLDKKNKKLRKLDFINKDKKLFDIIFIALHGSPGEDGGVQGMFESLDIKYTGSDVLSSSLAMNKVFTAQIYHANGLPYPEFIHVKKDGWKNYQEKALQDIENRVGFPCVVKPVDQGSAVGVTVVKTKDEINRVLDKTFKQFSWLMVQKFISGQEATCGVLETKGQIFPLPPTHILPNAGEFYDYKSKYKAGGSTHICPADFSPEINEEIQKLALLAHKALRCRGMSRTDIFYTNEDSAKTNVVDNGSQTSKSFSGNRRLYILETNTIPGMTPTSLLPEAADKAGISFSKMLDLIIRASL